MRLFLTFSLVMVAASFTHAAENQGDLKKMQGTWLIVKEIFGDKTIPDADLKKYKPALTVKDSTFSVVFDGKPLDSGKMKLDETKTPRAIDTESKNGTKMKGVYEIKGDTMTVVFAQPGQTRPKGIKTEKGTQQILIVYKRQK